MAKRRKRDDRRKRKKSERAASSKYGDSFDDDDIGKERPSFSTRPSRGRDKRRDTTVLIVALISICALLGGYFFYTTYYDDFFNPNNDNNNEPNIIPGNPDDIPDNGPDESDYPIPDFTPQYPSNPIVVIEVRNYGAIVLELYRNRDVLQTVDNFLDYARIGFYDGLIFHRVIDGFMIQGGGFNPDLTQKSIPAGKSAIPLEIDPNLKHTDGAISMARTSDPNSATSQFFINDGPQPSLEPGGVDQYGYAVFGQVIGGMEVVKTISGVQTQTENGMGDVPSGDVIINRVYEYYGPY